MIGQYTTKPLAPTNFKVGPGKYEISWTKSPTPSVRFVFLFLIILKLLLHFLFSWYKIKYKSVEEGSKADEKLIKSSNDQDSLICSTFLTVRNKNEKKIETWYV